MKSVLESGIPEHELFNSWLKNEESSIELSVFPIRDPDNGELVAAAEIIKKRVQNENTIKIEKAMKFLEREKQAFELFFPEIMPSLKLVGSEN